MPLKSVQIVCWIHVHTLVPRVLKCTKLCRNFVQFILKKNWSCRPWTVVVPYSGPVLSTGTECTSGFLWYNSFILASRIQTCALHEMTHQTKTMQEKPPVKKGTPLISSWSLICLIRCQLDVGRTRIEDRKSDTPLDEQLLSFKPSLVCLKNG